MGKLEKIIKFLFLLAIMFVFIVAVDIVVLVYVPVCVGEYAAPVKYVASQLTKEGSGGQEAYALSREGQACIDEFNGFAFLLDEGGDVVWSYRMPEELARHYALSDVVRFTRYYLKDYPVYTHITDDGVVVMGTERFKTWKYQLVFQHATLDIYKKIVPVMLAANIVLLLLVPVFILRHDLRKKEQERTAWIAGISHDIRTPLALALGYADEIMRMSRRGMVCGDAGRDGFAGADGSVLPEIEERARVIEEQALRIKTLVANLNTENKLVYGMGNWHKSRVLMPALIRETMCDIMNTNPGGKYDMSVIISEELEQLYVKGDSELIRRALENLINNAVGHNPQGCSICVSLARRPFFLWKAYAVEVSDNGCGVSKKQFKEFRTGFQYNKLPEHGLGIRLVRQIAAFHHWGVRFRNNESGGFSCTLYILPF